MNPFSSPAERTAHARALTLLLDAGVPVLIGGAYAMFHYTGVFRWTKDLNLFLRRQDEAAARSILGEAGYRTEVCDPIWLSKAWWGDIFIDLIYSSGNGLAVVDDDWIRYAPEGEALDIPARIVPVEEMIWSKGFVQERERWDGADVNHLLRARGSQLDWKRLIARFDSHWEVLLAHLVLFSYSYPNDRETIPRWVWRKLLSQARRNRDAGGEKVCRGTLLSRVQYAHDIGPLGYRDARELEIPGFHGADEAPPVPLHGSGSGGCPGALPLAVSEV